MHPIDQQAVAKLVRLGLQTPIQQVPPLASMNGRRDAESGQRGVVGQIHPSRAQKFQLSDQSRVLDKTLIVFGPGGGQFLRRVDRRSAWRVPTAAKAGRKAVAVDQVLKASNIVRLKRAEGQVRGVVRMVEEDRYCADTIIQIAAAQESLRAVAKNLLKNHLKHCARAALKAGEAEADAMCNELMDVMSKIAR